MAKLLEKDWIHARLRCLVLEMKRPDFPDLNGNVFPASFRNGYVEVKRSHPWYRIGYSECSDKSKQCRTHYCTHTPESIINIHCGITFAGTPLGAKNGWWFGFDCNHSQDMPFMGGTRKSLAYVVKECESLAEQLNQVEDGYIKEKMLKKMGLRK